MPTAGLCIHGNGWLGLSRFACDERHLWWWLVFKRVMSLGLMPSNVGNWVFDNRECILIQFIRFRERCRRHLVSQVGRCGTLVLNRLSPSLELWHFLLPRQLNIQPLQFGLLAICLDGSCRLSRVPDRLIEYFGDELTTFFAQ